MENFLKKICFNLRIQVSETDILQARRYKISGRTDPEISRDLAEKSLNFKL